MPHQDTSPSLRLYLVRHAQAGWTLPGEKDFDRTLSDVGYAQAEIIADLAADRGLRPDMVICSTARRCRETAEAFRRSIGEALSIDYHDTLYAGPVDVYGALIEAWRDTPSLMLIGHNPMMEELMQVILGDEGMSAAIPTGFPCAGLAVIDIDRTASPNATSPGRLMEFHAPRN